MAYLCPQVVLNLICFELTAVVKKKCSHFSGVGYSEGKITNEINVKCKNAKCKNREIKKLKNTEIEK